MNLPKWIVLGWIVASVLLMVAKTGKTPERLTGGVAASSVLAWGIVCWLVVIA